MVDPVLSGAFAPDPPPVGRSAQRDEIPRPGALSRRHTFLGFSVRVTAAPVLEGVPGGQGRRCRAGPVSFPQGAAGPREGQLPRRELHAGRDTNSLVGVTLALERENKGVTRLQEV